MPQPRSAPKNLIEVPWWARNVERWQWRRRIEVLDEPLRGAVAAIVWWDVFSVRMWPERWDDLDDLVGTAEAVTPEQLVAGLVAVGYEEHRARGRIFPQQNACARGRKKIPNTG